MRPFGEADYLFSEPRKHAYRFYTAVLRWALVVVILIALYFFGITTVAALLASFSTGSAAAVIVGLAHLSSNILGIVIFYPLRARARADLSTSPLGVSHNGNRSPTA